MRETYLQASSFRYKVSAPVPRWDHKSIPGCVFISVLHQLGKGKLTRCLFLLLGGLQLVRLLGKLLFPPPDFSSFIAVSFGLLTAIEHATPTSLYIISSDSYLKNKGMQEAYHTTSLGGADCCSSLEEHSDCYPSA
jgi:hypothetical protein